jgi:indoleamine 2,3-dioxygenase
MQGMRDVIYEGVTEFENRPQNFPGGSGAQSTLMPLLDAALGIRHAADALITYLHELRRYMPPDHQAFLSEVEGGSSVRDYVLRMREESLVEQYNRCVEELGNFRAEHLKMSVEYIQRPAQQQASDRGEHGTGGSPFVRYLKKHREETFAHRLDGATTCTRPSTTTSS